MEANELKYTNIGGVKIVTLSRLKIAKHLTNYCIDRRKTQHKIASKLLFDINGQGLSLFHSNPDYQRAMLDADMIHADGGFLVTLSKWFSGPVIEERSATTDMIHDLAQAAQDNGLSFFLLGGDEELNRSCAEILQTKYPRLNIVGRRNGYFKREEESQIIDQINSLAPDFLWIGMGKPLEQVLSARWKTKVNTGWIITCGGCFNFITGHYKRAPVWMQNANLEFVYRAMANPRTLLWRYLTTSPHALWIALTFRRNATVRTDTSHDG